MCEDCGTVTRMLDCHHTKEGYRHLHREQDHHLDVLCRQCHGKRHGIDPDPDRVDWNRIDAQLDELTRIYGPRA